MSEKTFAWLIRIYPAAFRRKYQLEVLQLCRDRLRDERGIVLRARLYLDLLLDALVGAPQAWRNSYAETRTAEFVDDSSGMPAFHLLDREPLGTGSVVAGCVFSFSALVGFGLVMRLPPPVCAAHGGRTMSPIAAVVERLNRAMIGPKNDGPRVANASIGGFSAQMHPVKNVPAHAARNSGPPLSSSEKGQVVQDVAENLTAHYFDAGKANAAVKRLRELEKRGAYAGITDGSMLAERLTADVQSATGDSHLNVAYSRNVISVAAPRSPTTAEINRYRGLLIQENCSVEKAELLPGKIGYLKFNSFPDMEVCGATLHKAMSLVDEAHAVIFDLRDNTGGFPETVADVAVVLFDRSVSWYNPRQAQSATTLAPTRKSKLADKPVYILTSSRTLSGAEQFTYNLKMLKRATVVGETTGGGGHVGTFHRLNEHFGIGIPENRITNPFGRQDWDGVGVEPDVKVKATDALNEAERLVTKRSQR